MRPAGEAPSPRAAHAAAAVGTMVVFQVIKQYIYKPKTEVWECMVVLPEKHIKTPNLFLNSWF